jgi:hypothetical protein
MGAPGLLASRKAGARPGMRFSHGIQSEGETREGRVGSLTREADFNVVEDGGWRMAPPLSAAMNRESLFVGGAPGMGEPNAL